MAEPTLIDSPVLALERIRIGRFRCAPAHPRFRDSGPISGWLVVFPRTSVWITHAGAEPILADSSRAMLYNRGQEYTRAAVGRDGDRCDYFAFAPETIAEATRLLDPSVEERVERPFARACAPVGAATYARQRRLFEHVTSGGAIDPLFVEEGALAILADVVAATHEPAPTTRSPRARTARAQAELVDGVRTIVARRLGDPLSLSAIAHAVGSSPFHVARVFQRRTGMGIHAYRQQLRLRASLERVAAGDELTRVALDLGFSSHSHFTTAFGRAFGVTPRAFRARK